MQNNQFVPSLTGIRAIAAFSVFIFHFNPFVKDSFLWRIANEGHIGVDIFFVLSGFLIAFRYYDNYSLNKKWIGQYVVNRIARIYPMYFLLTISTYIFFIVQAKLNTSYNLSSILKSNLFELFMNLTFLKGFFNGLKFSGIPQGWTLTVEECFYFSAPFIFLLSKRIKIIIIPFVLLLLGFIIVKTFGKSLPYGFFEDYRFMLIFTFFGKGLDFFLGILLALKYRTGKMQSKSYINFTFFALLFITMTVLFASYIRIKLYPPYGSIFLINFILPIFIVGLFWGLLNEETIIKRVLSSQLFVLLGKSSYIFYLIHMGIIQIFLSTYITQNILINFLILNFLSIIFFKFLEEPVNSNIKSWYAAYRTKKNTSNTYILPA